MPVGDEGDETMIAGTIVEAEEAKGLYTATPKTKVRLVGRMYLSSLTVLTLWWY